MLNMSGLRPTTTRVSATVHLGGDSALPGHVASPQSTHETWIRSWIEERHATGSCWPCRQKPNPRIITHIMGLAPTPTRTENRRIDQMEARVQRVLRLPVGQSFILACVQSEHCNTLLQGIIKEAGSQHSIIEALVDAIKSTARTEPDRSCQALTQLALEDQHPTTASPAFSALGSMIQSPTHPAAAIAITQLIHIANMSHQVAHANSAILTLQNAVLQPIAPQLQRDVIKGLQTIALQPTLTTATASLTALTHIILQYPHASTTTHAFTALNTIVQSPHHPIAAIAITQLIDIASRSQQDAPIITVIHTLRNTAITNTAPEHSDILIDGLKTIALKQNGNPHTETLAALKTIALSRNNPSVSSMAMEAFKTIALDEASPVSPPAIRVLQSIALELNSPVSPTAMAMLQTIATQLPPPTASTQAMQSLQSIALDMSRQLNQTNHATAVVYQTGGTHIRAINESQIGLLNTHLTGCITTLGTIATNPHDTCSKKLAMTLLQDFVLTNQHPDTSELALSTIQKIAIHETDSDHAITALQAIAQSSKRGTSDDGIACLIVIAQQSPRLRHSILTWLRGFLDHSPQSVQTAFNVLQTIATTSRDDTTVSFAITALQDMAIQSTHSHTHPIGRQTIESLCYIALTNHPIASQAALNGLIIIGQSDDRYSQHVINTLTTIATTGDVPETVRQYASNEIPNIRHTPAYTV